MGTDNLGVFGAMVCAANKGYGSIVVSDLVEMTPAGEPTCKGFCHGVLAKGCY